MATAAGPNGAKLAGEEEEAAARPIGQPSAGATADRPPRSAMPQHWRLDRNNKQNAADTARRQAAAAEARPGSSSHGTWTAATAMELGLLLLEPATTQGASNSTTPTEGRRSPRAATAASRRASGWFARDGSSSRHVGPQADTRGDGEKIQAAGENKVRAGMAMRAGFAGLARTQAGAV